MEFADIFQCDGVSANAIHDILGCGGTTARDLQVEISRLEPFQVISKSDINTERFTKFKAEAFFQSY